MESVIIDSNVYRSNFGFHNYQFLNFINNAKNSGFILIVPKVIWDEIDAKYEILCQEKTKQFSSFFKELPHLGLQESENIEFLNSLDRAPKNFENHFYLKFKPVGYGLLKYPEISHESVTQRAIGRIKPFNDKEKGYRDTLIWFSIIEHLKETNGVVHFISQNHKDFFHENELHQNLMDDLKNEGIPTENLKTYQSLKQFNESVMDPIVKNLSGILKSFEPNSENFGVLKTWIENNILSVLNYFDLARFTPGIQPDLFQSSMFVQNLGTDSVMPVKCQKWEKDYIVLQVEIELRLDMYFDIYNYGYYQESGGLMEITDFLDKTGSDEFFDNSVNTEMDFKITTQISFSPAQHSFEYITITNIVSEWGVFEPALPFVRGERLNIQPELNFSGDR